MKLKSVIKCPNCEETLNLEKGERIEKRFSCSKCTSLIDMKNLIDYRFEYFWVIKNLLENCLGSQPERTLLKMIVTPLVVMQTFGRVKDNLTNTTSEKLSLIYTLLLCILVEKMFLRTVSKEELEAFFSHKEIKEVFKGESVKMPSGVNLHRECEMFVKQTFIVAEEMKVQLSDIFVWGIPICYLQIAKGLFVVGDLFFNERSVVFIPYEKEFLFDSLWSREEFTAESIGQKAGSRGLSGQHLDYKAREKMTISASRKSEIQAGMNLYQKFLYNVGGEECLHIGYLSLPKTEITNAKIVNGALYIKTKEKKWSIGGFAISIAEQEGKDNLSFWLNNQYNNVSETFQISKTVPPKVLLDDLLDGIICTSANIDEFMREDGNTLLFCRLFKSLSEEQQAQIIKHLEEISPDLANKLKDDKFMIGIERVDQSNTACFIATVSYGGSNKASVKVLRDYRDEFLLKSDVGQKFVEQYYRWSPALASFVSKRPRLKAIIRKSILDPIVWFAQRRIKNKERK